MPATSTDRKVTANRLRELFDYDPETGFFTRVGKPKRGNARWEGVAGTVMESGYRTLAIDSVRFLCHRLAWLYVKGEFPKRWVVHLNGNRDDNRIENLALKPLTKTGALTQARLKEVLDYDAETGVFTWKVGTARGLVGSVAGVPANGGYRYIGVDGRKYLGHRLAWLYVHGRWAKEHVDHINGDPSDNRFCNLREASAVQNAHNTRNRQNKSGFKGVRQRGNRFLASIIADSRIYQLGSFGTAEEAHAAYVAAVDRLHGVFARKE